MAERIEGNNGLVVTIVEVARGLWRAQLAGSGPSVDFASLSAARLWANLACRRYATYGEAVASGLCG